MHMQDRAMLSCATRIGYKSADVLHNTNTSQFGEVSSNDIADKRGKHGGETLRSTVVGATSSPQSSLPFEQAGSAVPDYSTHNESSTEAAQMLFKAFPLPSSSSSFFPQTSSINFPKLLTSPHQLLQAPYKFTTSIRSHQTKHEAFGHCDCCHLEHARIRAPCPPRGDHGRYDVLPQVSLLSGRNIR